MNEEAIQDSYNVFVSQGYTKSIDEYKKLINSNPEALNDSYKAFTGQGYTKSIDDYKVLMGIGAQPKVKKKDSLESATQQTQGQATTELPVADGLSATQLPPRKKSKQELSEHEYYKDPSFEDNALKKAANWLGGIQSYAANSVISFADDVMVSARKSLQEEGFFDDDIPDTDTPITDAMKKKVSSKKGEILSFDPKYSKPQSDGGPMDPTPLIKGAAEIGLKIINSSLPQDQKNVIIAALNLGSANAKSAMRRIDTYQEKSHSRDNLPSKVIGGIVGMVPDLMVAGAMKNPAAAESRLAKWGAEVSKDARPLIQKYVPKAAKFVEEAVKAPFTKIMAGKGIVSGIAKAEEGEDIVEAGLEGGIEGAKEGIYMHALGVAAGKAMPVIAKQIGRTGINTAFSTAIANPLANAGVFTTAKALRTGIEEQRLISGEEAIMEAGTGVGFSLLHAGSLYKNHREANHYYDNTLKTDPLNSLGRVLDETKANLDLVYNPDLTETQIKDLESARDDLKAAIMKEPDLNNKKLLGDEALKIQNQLDANSAIKGIVENKDALIEAINTNENLSEELKSQKTKKVAAIADYFDRSEFGLKKKELDTKIDEAQKKLDDASLGFTNLTKASDRAQAKKIIEQRRLELESLNDELNNLIDSKDVVQEQSTAEIPVQSEAGVSETMEEGKPESKPEVVTEQGTQEELVEPLKDRESTAKALETANDDAYVKILNDYFTGGSQETTTQDVSNSYHSSKENNGNPELVKAVEELLAPKSEVTPPETIINEQAVAPEAKPVKEQWEIDYERRKAKVDEFNTENRPSALEDEQPRKRKNSYERSKLEDELYEAKKSISRADDADLAIEEYNKKKKELEDFDNKTQDVENNQRINDLIYDEIEQREKDNYEYSEEFNKDPREAALKSNEGLIEFLEERGNENDLEQIDRYKNNIKLLEKDIKDNPLKENTFLREEVAPTEVVPTEVKAEVAPVEEVKDLLDLDTTDKTNLKRVSDYLDKLDKSLDINPNELNDVTRVMAVGTAKAVIKTLKALVDAGVTLQEAIKMASAAHKVKEEQIVEALDIVSKINENKSEGISEFELKGYNKLSKVIDTAISNGKTVENVLNYMNGSEVYKRASQVQQELLVREVRKRFGLKEKSAPSVAKLFGKLKDITKITISEMKLIHNDIKMQNLGAKQVIKAFNEKKSELTKETDELVKQGRITVQQASNVVKRFAKVNLLSETSVGRFTEYMAKVFNKADYADKLTSAIKVKKSISKLSKNKDKNVQLTELGKKFSKIDPSRVDNIEEYNSIAADIKEAIEGSKKRLEEINWAGTVKIEDVAKYIDETIKAQDLKLREEKIAELQDLLGVDAKDFSAEEIDELLKTDKKMTKDNSAIAKATIKKGFDTYSTMIKDAIKTGKDVFTGEDVSYEKKNIDIIERFMDMDLDLLTDKQALAASDALQNFLINESTANMKNVLASYKGELNARQFKGKSIPLRKLWSGKFSRILTEGATPMGEVFTKLFKGATAGDKFGQASGFLKIVKEKATAVSKVNTISKEYINTFFKKKANGEVFNSAYNIAERGIASDLRRFTAGNEERDFKRRIKILDQSIEALSKGTDAEKEKSELYKKVKEKIVDGSNNLKDVEGKIDKVNLDAIKKWQETHEQNWDELSDYSLNVYNKILEKGVNYSSPDKYMKLSSEQASEPLQSNESMYGGNGDYLYKKEASGLMKAEFPEDLPKGRYRDYSFDQNNINSVHDALVDMHTGEAIRELEAFRKSEYFEKIITSAEDRNLLNRRFKLYVDNLRNKGNTYGAEDLKPVIKVLDRVGTIGVGLALGSPTQMGKQVVPVMFNTFANAGKVNLGATFNPKFVEWLNKSGYGIANRGAESQAQIESLNKKIETATSNANLLKAVEKANKFWLREFLVRGDVYIAKASWQTYYEKSLKKQGKETKGIDYSDHKINKDAAEYAEMMTQRQQNVNDPDLGGSWFTSNRTERKMLGKVFLNFANFRMNQSSRLAADLTTLGHWSVATPEDRAIAARSLGGYAVEQVMYRVMAAGISIGIGSIAQAIRGVDESDNDKDKRIKATIKGQQTSTAVDFFSPAPFLDMAIKPILSYTTEGIEEATGVPISTYGNQKETYVQTLGGYGIAADRALELWDVLDLANSGTYKDDFGKEKKISSEDQETIQGLAPLAALSILGILPSDISSGVRNVVKYSKKEPETLEHKLLGTFKNKEEMKEKDPEMYQENFGKGSDYYEYKKEEKEANVEKKEAEKEMKEDSN